MRFPDDLPEEHVHRLQVIAAKCPVHRALDARSCSTRSALRAVHLAAWDPTAAVRTPAEQVAAAVARAASTSRVRVRNPPRSDPPPGDLRRHAGEISFPGGRRDAEDADLSDSGAREAEEGSGWSVHRWRVLGELPPTSTFATNT